MNADQQLPDIDAATALEASGDCRVLRKRGQFGASDGVLDEMAGLDPASDEKGRKGRPWNGHAGSCCRSRLLQQSGDS